jgi:hypothetical protein
MARAPPDQPLTLTERHSPRPSWPLRDLKGEALSDTAGMVLSSSTPGITLRSLSAFSTRLETGLKWSQKTTQKRSLSVTFLSALFLNFIRYHPLLVYVWNEIFGSKEKQASFQGFHTELSKENEEQRINLQSCVCNLCPHDIGLHHCKSASDENHQLFFWKLTGLFSPSTWQMGRSGS